MAGSVPIILKPRKFPPGCGPNAPKTGAAFRWYFQRQRETPEPAPEAEIGAIPKQTSSPVFSNPRSSSPSSDPWRRRKVARKSQPDLAEIAAGGDGSRTRVSEMLESFRRRCRELLSLGEDIRRVDMQAFNEFNAKGLISQTAHGNRKLIGPVPGVEIGSKFIYRAELLIAGLHGKLQHGIDCATVNGRLVATCVVAAEGHDDSLGEPDVVVYTGEGGGGRKRGEAAADQRLTKGNLALKNSIEVGNEVRVVRGVKLRSSKAGKTTYIYDGLYLVMGFEYQRGVKGNLVYRFQLKRKAGQPQINWRNHL